MSLFTSIVDTSCKGQRLAASLAKQLRNIAAAIMPSIQQNPDKNDVVGITI